MRELLRLLRCEWIKLKRSRFLLIGILGTLKNIYVIPVTELTPLSALFFLIRILFGDAFLCVTQLPFIGLTIRTKGFMVPMITVAAVILVNVVLSGTGVAGFYPWAASYLLVTGHMSGQSCPAGVSVGIIAGMGLLGLAASLGRVRKEEG